MRLVTSNTVLVSANAVRFIRSISIGENIEDGLLGGCSFYEPKRATRLRSDKFTPLVGCAGRVDLRLWDRS